MAILLDDFAEKIESVCGEAFDLSGFDRLRPEPVPPEHQQPHSN